jgi:hypothetical protein
MDQLIEPHWKGKIIMDNSRRPGPGSANLGHLLMVLDENWVVRRFLANNSVIVDNPRQLAEFIIAWVLSRRDGLKKRHPYIVLKTRIHSSEAAAAEVVSGRPSGHVTGARALLTGRGE